MKGIFLLLGSNLGDREAMLRMAREKIGKQCGALLRSSAVYKTAAWGYEDQPDFLNQVVEISSELAPDDLLTCLLQIELEMGRRRYEKWHERLLDIDILYHHDVVCQTDRLTLPHPEIQNRRFALMPLCDLAAGEVHPVLKKTQQQLLNECPDTLWAEKLG